MGQTESTLLTSHEVCPGFWLLEIKPGRNYVKKRISDIYLNYMDTRFLALLAKVIYSSDKVYCFY